MPGFVEVSEAGAHYEQLIQAGRHRLTADEPPPSGADAGPTPYEYLLAALGTCTSMTLRMYAERKGIPLEGVTVRLRHDRIHAEDTETGGRCETITREIALEGPLDDEQRARLLEIADRCPVHRTLTGDLQIETALAP